MAGLLWLWWRWSRERRGGCLDAEWAASALEYLVSGQMGERVLGLWLMHPVSSPCPHPRVLLAGGSVALRGGTYRGEAAFLGESWARSFGRYTQVVTAALGLWVWG